MRVLRKRGTPEPKCCHQKTRCSNGDTNEWAAKKVPASDDQICCAADNGQPGQYGGFAQPRHVTGRQRQISRAEQQQSQTKAGIKSDPAVPQVCTPGQYRTRCFHGGGGRSIARCQLIGKERIGNVNRAKKAPERRAKSNEDLI